MNNTEVLTEESNEVQQNDVAEEADEKMEPFVEASAH